MDKTVYNRAISRDIGVITARGVGRKCSVEITRLAGRCKVTAFIGDSIAFTGFTGMNKSKTVRLCRAMLGALMSIEGKMRRMKANRRLREVVVPAPFSPTTETTATATATATGKEA